METIVTLFVITSKTIPAGRARRFSAASTAAGQRPRPFDSILTIRLRAPVTETAMRVAERSATARANTAAAASYIAAAASSESAADAV
jgi:hypothetical protein